MRRTRETDEDYFLREAREAYLSGQIGTEEYEVTVERVMQGDPPPWMGMRVG